MTAALAMTLIVRPTLTLLPVPMRSPAAAALLVAIGLQESTFAHRRQQPHGPARGFWQFEELGATRGVLEHPASRQPLFAVLETLSYPSEAWVIPAVYQALEHNDVLACAAARCLLWTLPVPLPARGDPQDGWEQYLACWRPGKPHRETWNGYYAQAWEVVEGGPAHAS